MHTDFPNLDYPKLDYLVYYPRQYENYQPITIFNEKEEPMSLTKEYKHDQQSKENKLAIDLDALNEDGTLTAEGKDLLLNILLDDPEIRKKFDKALSDIMKEEDF